MEKKLLIGIVAVAVLLLTFFIIPRENSSCITLMDETVRGTSMQGIVENGQQIKVKTGYYLCNEMQREDIIIYNYAGSDDPLIKRVVAIPGDTFGFIPDSGSYNLIVNGEVVTTTTNSKYRFSKQQYSLLNLYVADYNNTIPPNAVLVLGNQAGGTTDSSVFGLISINDIIGKAKI